MIAALLDRLTGRTARAEDAQEQAAAELLDSNVARLRREDPDADQIFTTSFADARLDDWHCGRLVAEIQAYATAKQTQGRMDLYEALFAGLDN